MIQISEAAALALHSMIYMANRENNTVSLKEIAGKFDVSEHHLSKVLQRLTKAGYLSSTKGPKGGFKINNAKLNSTFMEIYELIEGKYTRTSCLFSSKENKNCCCIMGELLSNINNEFENFMNNRKINDFKL